MAAPYSNQPPQVPPHPEVQHSQSYQNGYPGQPNGYPNQPADPNYYGGGDKNWQQQQQPPQQGNWQQQQYQAPPNGQPGYNWK